MEAVDYLVKPIPFPRFLEACQRVIKKQQTQFRSKLEQPADLVYIKSGSTIHKLNAREILFLERDENYVVYHTTQSRILSRQSLNSLEASLPDYFVRIHKSYIVSLLHVNTLKTDQVIINGKPLPIGKTYRAELNAQFSGLIHGHKKDFVTVCTRISTSNKRNSY